jgi:two-component system KDP operon response regulator KdpE
MRSQPAPFRRDLGLGPPFLLTVESAAARDGSLATLLGRHGFRTLGVAPRVDDIVVAIRHEPDLVVLDVRDVSAQALDLIARLRTWTSAALLVVLRRAQEDRSAAIIDAGADDYLFQPVSPAELLARVRVWLNQRARAEPPSAPVISTAEPLRIEPERRTVIVDGREVHITPLESKLLMALALRGGGPMTEQQVQAAVWGARAKVRPSYLRACIRQLQQKIELDPTRPRRLMTDGNGGLRLEVG